MFESVLSPGKIGNLTIRNRFVMPAMGAGHSNGDGTITDETIQYYVARARGGFGLIITEFTGVDPLGMNSDQELKLYSDEYIPQFKKLVDAVHAEGATFFLQLHHGGRTGDSNITGHPLQSSSTIAFPIQELPMHAMTTEEVYAVIEKFGDAALRAKKAGYDGVELHGGHGYLLAQFMSPLLNRRTDEFGGDILGRSRICTKIIRNIKEKCGEDFPVIMRISGDEVLYGGMKLNETRVFVKLFEKAGVDALNITVGLPFGYGDNGDSLASYMTPQGFNTYASEEIKKSVSVPVIAVGRIIDPLMADAVIEDKMADFVALGRASIADPEFPRKVAEGRTDEISPCTGCLARCISGPNKPGSTCCFNPFSGNESTMKLLPTENPKTVVVVGAGVAGLETAWVSAKKGHKVILIEKDGRVGGQAYAASVPRGKQRIANVVKYYLTMCRKHGVDIRLNTEATVGYVLSLKPDAVVLSTGAKPFALPVENDGIQVVNAIDILNGTILPAKNPLVVGGGLVGLEVADYIMTMFRPVTVVEMTDSVGEDMIRKDVFIKGLKDGGVRIMTGTKVLKFTSDGAVCAGAEGEITLSGFDMIVSAVGSKAYNPLEEELRGKVGELYVIGDAKKPRRLENAVQEAADTALALN